MAVGWQRLLLQPHPPLPESAMADTPDSVGVRSLVSFVTVHAHVLTLCSSFAPRFHSLSLGSHLSLSPPLPGFHNAAGGGHRGQEAVGQQA